jgi:hypothetical protein
MYLTAVHLNCSESAHRSLTCEQHGAVRPPGQAMGRVRAIRTRGGGTQSRGKPCSRTLIDEMRPRFQAARTAWTVLQVVSDRLQPTALPAVPGKSPGGSLFMAAVLRF